MLSWRRHDGASQRKGQNRRWPLSYGKFMKSQVYVPAFDWLTRGESKILKGEDPNPQSWKGVQKKASFFHLYSVIFVCQVKHLTIYMDWPKLDSQKHFNLCSCCKIIPKLQMGGGGGGQMVSRLKNTLFVSVFLIHVESFQICWWEAEKGIYCRLQQTSILKVFCL